MPCCSSLPRPAKTLFLNFCPPTPLRHLQTVSTAISLCLKTRAVLSSSRKYSLDPAALSSYCCKFHSFCCWTSQISRLHLLPPFSPDIPWNQTSVLTTLRKRILHCFHAIVAMAYLCFIAVSCHRSASLSFIPPSLVFSISCPESRRSPSSLGSSLLL